MGNGSRRFAKGCVSRHSGDKSGRKHSGAAEMKKFLIILVLVLIAIGAGAVWLAGQATSGMPEPGEVRQEIENAF